MDAVSSAHALRLQRKRDSYQATGTRVAVSVQISPTVRRRLEQHPGIRAQIQAITDGVAELADATCPRGSTGDLAASQRTQVLTTPNGPVGVVAYMQFYAHMVHNGTRHSPPQPWLLNALLAVGREVHDQAQARPARRRAA